MTNYDIMPTHRLFQDLTGKRFGKLTVNKFVKTQKHFSLWECRCDCGNMCIVKAPKMKNGHTKSCGCYRDDVMTKHGCNTITNGKSPEYQIWSAMITRCSKNKSISKPRYDGRGIAVCDRWRDFKNFLLDMGKRPSDKHSIDRIDNDDNYEPSNCRWATLQEQQRNRGNNRLLEYQGRICTVTEWGERLAISRNLIGSRLFRGWSVEKALSTPIMKRKEEKCG